MLDFIQTIQKGKPGEIIFENEFLKFLKIKYVNVSECHSYQIIDADINASIGLYEIKTNYKDDEQLVIEEYSNFNESLGPIKLGWFYTTKADIIVFISKITHQMILLPMNDILKNYYETIKIKYKLIPNEITTYNGNCWQSAFRRIPLIEFKNFYSKYRMEKKAS